MTNIPYAWVSEGSERKYWRAIDELKKNGKEVNEANIKELYTLYHGLVLEVPEPAKVETKEEVKTDVIEHKVKHHKQS